MGDGIGDFAFWLAIGLASLGLTLGPIGKALGRWIESWGQPRQAELDEPALARLAEVDGLGQRLLELEERMDFAERVLVEARKPALEDADTPPEAADAVRG
jgi:hypothetical protein